MKLPERQNCDNLYRTVAPFLELQLPDDGIVASLICPLVPSYCILRTAHSFWVAAPIFLARYLFCPLILISGLPPCVCRVVDVADITDSDCANVRPPSAQARSPPPPPLDLVNSVAVTTNNDDDGDDVQR